VTRVSLPEGLGVGGFGGGRLGHVVEQELVEVAVFHVLHDHAERLLPHTHSQHAHDVRVLQLGHDLDLFLEISPETRRQCQDETPETLQ